MNIYNDNSRLCMNRANEFCNCEQKNVNGGEGNVKMGVRMSDVRQAQAGALWRPVNFLIAFPS